MPRSIKKGAYVDGNVFIDFLTGAGYPNAGPIPAPPLTIESTGERVGLTPLWNSIVLTARVAPDNSNVFLQYDDAQVRRMFAMSDSEPCSRVNQRRLPAPIRADS